MRRKTKPTGTARTISTIPVPEEAGGGVLAATTFGFPVPPGMMVDLRGLDRQESALVGEIYAAIVLRYAGRQRGIASAETDPISFFGHENVTRLARAASRLLERTDYELFVEKVGLVSAATGGAAHLREWLEGIVRLVRERDEQLEASRERRRLAKRARREIRPAGMVTDTSCAEAGCNRYRVFFGEDGVGYCKRHGNERGLRPHGKVT